MALFSNTDTQAAKPKSLALGQIDGIQVTGTMSGYTTGSLTIAAPPAGGVQATATFVAVAGVITSVTIVNPGAGYLTAPVITAPAGTGAVIVGSVRDQMGDANTLAGVNENAKIIFVDITEAGVVGNRARGIRTPGWNKYEEFVDAQGTTKYKVETLIAMSVTAGNAGDNTDDAIVSDAAFTITVQPADTSTSSGAASFTVTATGATSYQWQVRLAAGGQFSNLADDADITGSATDTLSLANQVIGVDGNTYRCQVFNTTSGSAATSTAATLTFVD